MLSHHDEHASENGDPAKHDKDFFAARHSCVAAISSNERTPATCHADRFRSYYPRVWTLPIVAEEADFGGAVRSRFGRCGLESSIQHRSDTARARGQAKSQDRQSHIVSDSLGAGSFMIRDRGQQARVLRCIEIPQVSDPSGRFLRVAEDWQGEAALLF
jgi:hypothetical protein